MGQRHRPTEPCEARAACTGIMVHDRVHTFCANRMTGRSIDAWTNKAKTRRMKHTHTHICTYSSTIVHDPCLIFRSLNMFTLLDACVSSLRRGHVNLLCVVPNFKRMIPEGNPSHTSQSFCTVRVHDRGAKMRAKAAAPATCHFVDGLAEYKILSYCSMLH